MRWWRIRVAANVIGLAAAAGFLLPGGEAAAQILITTVYQVGETIPNFKQEIPRTRGFALVTGSASNITIIFVEGGSTATYDDGTVYTCQTAPCAITGGPTGGLVSGNAVTVTILSIFDATLNSSSERPAGNPDRNVPEADESDKGLLTLTINTDIIPNGILFVRVAYALTISGGTDPLAADVFRVDVTGNGSLLQSAISEINSSQGAILFSRFSDDFLTVTFTVFTASDADLDDETLTITVDEIAFLGSGGTTVGGFNPLNIADIDGDGNGSTASLTLWDPGTAKIAADNTTVAENEATTFTVTLAGLRTPDSEDRAVDHWPVRVNFPPGVIFTKNDRTLESAGYDIEISGNVPTTAISVPGDTRHAIEIAVAASAIMAETNEEAGREVIIYTFRPKPGAHASTPSVAVILAPLAGMTNAEMPTNNIYVPNDASSLTFSINEPIIRLPSAINAISIDDDSGPGDTSTSIIAESGTIVVTVTLDQPLPQGGEIKYRILPGDDSPIEGRDMEGNVGGGSENTATPPEGTTVSFSVNVTDDNRIEPNMEQGVIEIFRLDLPGNPPALIATDNTADFTIRDNDRISLSIADQTVSENTVSFDYAVTATAAPVPANADGVVLDRAVTATLNSADDTAITNNANNDYTAVTDAAVVFPINAAAQTRLISTPSISITVADDGDTNAERFILSLDSDDPAAILPDRATAAITIAPDPVSAFAGTATVTFIEGVPSSQNRTLTINGAPGGSSAVVSFRISDGTVSIQDDLDHDFRLAVESAPGVITGVSNLTVSEDNTRATFTIPADNFANGSAMVILNFTPIIGMDAMPKRITFSVAGIRFPGNSDYDVNEGLPTLTIIITEAVAALTRPNAEASENGGSGHFTVTIDSQRARTATIVAELSGGANFAGTEDADYDITVFLAGDRDANNAIISTVTGAGSTRTLSFSMASSANPVDVVVSARADNYDELPEEVILRLVSAAFTDSGITVEQLSDPASRTITITDHDDDVSDATLDKSSDPREAGPVSGTFTLELLHAPDEDAEVAYTFVAGASFGVLGENYTASIAGADGGTAALTAATGTFTVPRANITGSGGDAEGSNPGEAVATITITPINDDNSVSEDVKLTINAIRFGDNASTHGDLTAIAICPTGSVTCPGDPGSQTLRIVDDESATAAYDTTTTITLTEDSNTSATRVILLANTPPRPSTATFTLTGGVTTGADNPDVVITVGDGADTLSFTDDGTGGTFRIPANDPSVTITFTSVADDGDGDNETIAFTLTGIDFENSENDIGPLIILTIITNEPDAEAVQLRVRVFLEGALQ